MIFILWHSHTVWVNWTMTNIDKQRIINNSGARKMESDTFNRGWHGEPNGVTILEISQVHAINGDCFLCWRLVIKTWLLCRKAGNIRSPWYSSIDVLLTWDPSITTNAVVLILATFSSRAIIGSHSVRSFQIMQMWPSIRTRTWTHPYRYQLGIFITPMTCSMHGKAL